MNNILSINRIGLLLKRFLIQNIKKDIRFFGAVLACVALFAIIRLPEISIGPDSILIIALSIYVAGTIFKKHSDRNFAMAYTMLPASSLEKAIVNILLVSVYYVIAFFCIQILGIYLGKFLASMIGWAIHGTLPDISYQVSCTNDFGIKLLALIMFQSIFIFGSIYFRKYAIVKTILLGLGFAFLLGIIGLIIIASFVDTGTHYVYSTPEVIGIGGFVTMMIISTLFFWTMTYLRLKETEV